MTVFSSMQSRRRQHGRRAFSSTTRRRRKYYQGGLTIQGEHEDAERNSLLASKRSFAGGAFQLRDFVTLALYNKKLELVRQAGFPSRINFLSTQFIDEENVPLWPKDLQMAKMEGELMRFIYSFSCLTNPAFEANHYFARNVTERDLQIFLTTVDETLQYVRSPTTGFASRLEKFIRASADRDEDYKQEWLTIVRSTELYDRPENLDYLESKLAKYFQDRFKIGSFYIRAYEVSILAQSVEHRIFLNDHLARDYLLTTDITVDRVKNELSFLSEHVGYFVHLLFYEKATRGAAVTGRHPHGMAILRKEMEPYMTHSTSLREFLEGLQHSCLYLRSLGEKIILFWQEEFGNENKYINSLVRMITTSTIPKLFNPENTVIKLSIVMDRNFKPHEYPENIALRQDDDNIQLEPPPRTRLFLRAKEEERRSTTPSSSSSQGHTTVEAASEDNDDDDDDDDRRHRPSVFHSLSKMMTRPSNAAAIDDKALDSMMQGVPTAEESELEWQNMGRSTETSTSAPEPADAAPTKPRKLRPSKMFNKLFHGKDDNRISSKDLDAMVSDIGTSEDQEIAWLTSSSSSAASPSTLQPTPKQKHLRPMKMISKLWNPTAKMKSKTIDRLDKQVPTQEETELAFLQSAAAPRRPTLASTLK